MTEKEEAAAGGVTAVRLDPRFRHEVMKFPGGETLKTCFQCGTCTSSCPVARFSGSYRPRRILQMAQLGMKSKVLSSEALWLCAACFTCTDRCPQGVEVASVLRVLRNMAVEEGVVPAAYRELASQVLATGYAYPITKTRLGKREQLGLPPLPEADLEALAGLAGATGFSGLKERWRSSGA